jgi:hypothetical protein
MKARKTMMILGAITAFLIPFFALAVCLLPIYIHEDIEMKKRGKR